MPMVAFEFLIFHMGHQGGKKEDFEIPFWQDLGVRFYQKVNRLARKYAVSRAELLEDALNTYEKCKKALVIKKTGAPVNEEQVKKVFGQYAKEFWDSRTPEQMAELKAQRKKAAETRWAKERKKKKG